MSSTTDQKRSQAGKETSTDLGHNRNRILGAEIITDYLVHKKVPYLFGLCGHGIMGLTDSVYDRSDVLKSVSVHHESVAPFMADAFYRVSHRPVATFTSCGPGSSNLYVAVASAQADSSAMLVLTGNVATSQWNRGTFQESSQFFQGDFVNSLRPYVKRSFQPTRVDMLPQTLRQAFDLLESGRPGPVHIDIPFNVFQEGVEKGLIPDEHRPAQMRTRPAADLAMVRETLRLLQQAERPVIVAGHGIQIADAEAELLSLVEFLNIPVVTSPMGKDVVPSRHPLNLGPNGRNGNYPANAGSRNADVVVAIGTRFDDRSTSSWLHGYTYSIPPTKLVHVDNNPGEIGKNYPAEIGIVADAKVFCTQLLAEAKSQWERRESHGKWLQQCDRWRDKWEKHISRHRHSDAVPIRPERLIHDLRKALPDDGILVSDVGLFHNWLISEFDTLSPRSLLHSWGFGSMGFGVAGCLGAKLAAPHRPVVAVCGDGGFHMFPNAVATAVEYDIPVVWVIWNNLGYVSILQQQLGNFGDTREFVTSFRHEPSGRLLSTDFAMMARAMGADGVLMDRPQDLAGQISAALSSGRPTVLDVRVDREARLTSTGSWELPPLPPARPSFGWQEDYL